MKFLSNICPLLLLVSLTINQVLSSRRLIITNDGPAILGSNITFTAVLQDYVPKSNLLYVFSDGIQKLQYETRAVNVSLSVELSSTLYDEGTYLMNVTVEENFIIWSKTVIANYSIFSVQRDLIGEILVFRGNISYGNDVDEVAVGENVTIVTDLHNPSGFLNNSLIEYAWSIDAERHQTLKNVLTYNFSDAGVKEIKSFASATFPNNDFRVGFFDKMITAKVPVNNVNISGNPFIFHGEILNLTITCSGSPPFTYCHEFVTENTSVENFTCTHLATFTSCHMEIFRYFQDYGTYHVGIYISNGVKDVKRILEIMVINVTVHPTLSTVIIPIVCSLLTLIIIAIGIALYVQQRNQLAVEVANFDFQDDSDSYSERTFFEKIFDSFTCKNCRRSQFACGDNESDPLI
ncbi:Transmembrane protein 130, partial [Stegodyphus mimosarum]